MTQKLCLQMFQLVQDSISIILNKLYETQDSLYCGFKKSELFHFANIFMSHLENNYLQDCDPSFKLFFYKRYGNDTIVSFQKISQAHQFLKHINSSHANIKFTKDIEKESAINFFEVSIHRSCTSFSNVF